MPAKIKIRNKRIGENCPAFVVAEVSANHSRKLTNALRLIRAAARAGADAVKFQTYTPDTMTINCESDHFMIKHPKWGGRSLYKMYKESYTPWRWFRKLKRAADDEGILFFSTAFDKTAVDLLEDLGVPVHKVASFELVDLSLIEYMAKTGKPIILSTGMATILEIKEAVAAAGAAGAKRIILLKCVSSYPASPKEMNLRTIEDMKRIFGCPVGLSDHTLGIGASITAVSLGADMIEKHFTLSRGMKTPDSFFSLEPEELKNLVDEIRVAERAFGGVRYGLSKGERESLAFRRSLFAVRDIKKGEAFTADNVRSIRPGYGMQPKYLGSILGKKAKMKIKKGVPFRCGMVAGVDGRR